MSEGNKLGAAKSGLDIGMGTAGLIAGPYGLTLSAGYFAIDATIGWDNAMNTATNITNRKRTILGPTWSPYRMGSPFINK